MYINHLCTDRELVEAAQYVENPHLRLLADRLDDKLTVIQKAKDRIAAQEGKDDVAHMKPNEIVGFVDQLKDILGQ